ncbi:MAG: hypothetical protein IKG58_02845, partial [Bacilli bacterium]|nr:hypothetical protein [Bacilli bacterium]
TTTLDKAKYPRIKGDEGLYYLHINPNSIVDIEGNKMDSSVRTKFGPYKFDEKAPECKVEPTGTLKLGWYTSDVTYKLNKEQLSGGPVVDYGSSDTNNKVYNKSNPSKLTNDGKDIKRYGFVKDEAGNEGSCNVSVNRDTKPPTVPNITLYKKNNANHLDCSANSERGLGTIASDKFYNKYVYARAKDSTDAGIGLDTYKLTTSGQDDDVTNASQSCRNVHKAGKKVTIKFKACDKLGHCSNEKIAYTKLDRTPPIIYVKSGYNPGGFAWNSYGYGEKERHLFCDDDYSGVKPDTFSVDLVRGHGYDEWAGCDSRNCKYHSKSHISHDYKATGDKETVYRCKDEAGNYAIDNEHDTSSYPRTSNSASAGFVLVRCGCRWKNNPGSWAIQSYAVNDAHKCQGEGESAGDPGCDCYRAHNKTFIVNNKDDLFMNCFKR